MSESKLKLISINITKQQEKFIDQFITQGYFPNRSEAIRCLLNDGIKLQIKIINIKDGF